MRGRTPGFTLIEALIAMTVVALLVALAVPAVGAAFAATRSGDAKARIVSTLLAALGHSTVTGAEVVICPSGDGESCSSSIDWSGGWIAFADLDGNRVRGPGETMLRRDPALAGDTRLRSTSGRTRIVFQPHGGAAAGSNVTFTLCDGRGPAKATAVVLANSGRIRQDTATPEAAQACLQLVRR